MSAVTEEVTPVDDFLAHYGVLGMHWGKHKESSTIAEAIGLTSGRTPRDKHGNIKKPSYARAVLVGPWANSKKRYTDPKALKLRTDSGKLAAASLLTGLTASGLGALSMMSKSPNLAMGASSAAGTLRTGAGAVGLASLVFGVVAARKERQHRTAANGG